MLIHVDSSAIADAIGKGASAAKSTACIDHLLCAHHEGEHIVSIEPEDVEALVASSPRLSPDAFAVLHRIHATAPEILGLRDRLAWHLEVGIGATFDRKEHSHRGTLKVIRAELQHFHLRRCARGAVLLGEHLSDAWLYKEIGEIVRIMGALGEISLYLEHHMGAGSSMGEVFATFAEEGRILLAIADSDQRQKGGAMGTTWRGLRRVAEGKPSFQRARVLEVRTAENLIPLDAYEVVIQKHNKKDPRLAAIEQLRLLSDEQRAYEDLKKAISQKILVDVVDWLKNETPGRAARLLGLHTNAHLNELAEEVVAWGCAAPPLIT